MKLSPEVIIDGQYHQYCIDCYQEAIRRTFSDGKTYYICDACGEQNDRSIVIDPGINFWVADDGEYWHESVGVFVRDKNNRFLCFERSIFPFALTIPSGHVERDTQPIKAARRELKEEVGIDINEDALLWIASEDIVGDLCRRGSDSHRWHAYLCRFDDESELVVNDEGSRPVRLTLAEISTREVVYPVKYIIARYQNELIR